MINLMETLQDLDDINIISSNLVEYCKLCGQGSAIVTKDFLEKVERLCETTNTLLQLKSIQE